MKKETNSINSKYYLIIGVVLYLIGFLTVNIFSDNTVNSQEGLLKMMGEIKYFLVVFIFIVIIAPIMEELAFRLWLTERKYTKYTSLSLITAVSYLAFHSVTVSVIIFILLLFSFFFFKKKSLTQMLSVTLTSLIFAVFHYHNFSHSARWFLFIELTGIAFILSYVILRFGFIYGVLLHSVNNLIALSMLLAFSSNYSGVFESDDYTAQLEKQSIFKAFNLSSTSYSTKDSLVIESASLTSIALDLLPFESNVIYKTSPSSFTNYNFIAYSKLGQPINKILLFNDFIKQAHIITDTAWVPAYTMQVADSVKLSRYISSKGGISLEYFCSYLRLVQDVPLLLEIPSSFLHLNFKFDTDIFLKGITQDKIEKLYEYGIEVKKTQSQKIKVITLKES